MNCAAEVEGSVREMVGVGDGRDFEWERSGGGGGGGFELFHEHTGKV